MVRLSAAASRRPNVLRLLGGFEFLIWIAQRLARLIGAERGSGDAPVRSVDEGMPAWAAGGIANAEPKVLSG